MKSEATLRRLSIAVGIFAIAVASLVGLGQRSIELPLLVGGCVIASWIYTDWLRWIQLPRWVVYIMMVLGSFWAIMDYLNQSTFQQLFAVANLLVYAQLPLLFQAKSRRIFEQMGIFLLLELVVAALVNEDVIYGFFLIPVLVLGALVMMLFAQYISLEREGIRKIESHGGWTRLQSLLGLKRIKEIDPLVSMKMLDQDAVHRQGSLSWWQVGLPTTLAVAVFAVIYFSTAPRLSLGSYSAGGAMVGISDRVYLDQVGPISQNPRPILKVELYDARTNRDYELFDPPYLRTQTLTEYTRIGTVSQWQPGEYSRLRFTSMSQDLLPLVAAKASFSENLDVVEVRISEIHPLETPAVIPPYFASDDEASRLRYKFDRDTWGLIDTMEDELKHFDAQRRRLNFYTMAFQKGKQTRFLPETEELVDDHEGERIRASSPPYEELSAHQLMRLLDFRKDDFPGLIALRDRVLGESSIDKENVVDRALELENYLATNSEFSYTLNLTMPRDRNLDATEDFVVNQKSGHCQFYASALALMLRSEGIPTRLVNGLRPIEYNAIGDYFLVRQSHAHTWVEAYFTKEQFGRTQSLLLPPNYQKGAWVRLDPTPAGPGSNSRRPLSKPPSATWDFAQQLWKDYVVRVDRTDRSGMLQSFGEWTGGGYQDYFERLQSFSSDERGSLLGSLGLGRGGNARAWFGLGALVVMVFLLYRFRHLLFRIPLPGIQRAKKRQAGQVTLPFYRRCVRALEKLGWSREYFLTHQEFAKRVALEARSRWQLEADQFPVEQLTEAYCQARYGGANSEVGVENSRLEGALSRLEAAAETYRKTQGPKRT